MKNPTLAVLPLLVSALLAGSAAAGPAPKAAADSADFARLKTLVGSWEGTASDSKEKVTVEYSLTAGGSALVEKLFPGTTHEMLSVYYDRGGKVAMTHYCMLGNHPELRLKSSGGKSLRFELAGRSGLGSAKEDHMHSLTVTIPDADHLTQEWTSFHEGKSQKSSVFTFARAGKGE